MHLDIIIFAAIAVFLALRLKSVLGSRPDNDRQRPNPFVEAEKTAKAEAAPAQTVVPLPLPARTITAPDGTDAETAAGLQDIATADPSFDPADFMTGAKAAFEMIVTAFNTGDRATLTSFVSPKLYADFDAAIAEREQAGHIAETVIHRIQSARITAAKLGGVMAYVTVTYDVEQTAFTRDRTGAVIDGNPDTRATIENIWTFSRDIRADDPNWTLIETAAAS